MVAIDARKEEWFEESENVSEEAKHGSLREQPTAIFEFVHCAI
jgi:hypothetical protein